METHKIPSEFIVISVFTVIFLVVFIISLIDIYYSKRKELIQLKTQYDKLNTLYFKLDNNYINLLQKFSTTLSELGKVEKELTAFKKPKNIKDIKRKILKSKLYNIGNTK